ncbi:WD repeat-containing protein CG11141 [Anthonomus grandis grandis]|uniref:WD repeat-containing protein CG11141 n=1 Tax=Anthonomus grandis grandis TaxID=2921223 RepID=UPI00216542FA|nr:WD repeat-containing protein CG11141 [Anthonomus grandis grandis]
MAQTYLQSILREWAPLTDLLDKLPAKSGGLFSYDVKVTCLDVLSGFLVLGTNIGILFWYDRKRKDLQRLRCENSHLPITCVKAVSTVDYMVACGNQAGNVTIFQIPKSHPESLPENLKPQPKQVERYSVSDLHKSPITALEWSKNGMKLFSGDKAGSVVLTELDFYMHVCKSLEILNESYEVVQLSYRQQHLLISTTFRSIICHHLDKWKVCQVGKKDRKVLGQFGGIIYQQGFKPNDVVLYCMRPGLRIWIADSEGEVQKTLLFKDLLSKNCPQVPLLNPISKALQQLKPQREASFGIVRQFCDNLLVTHNQDVVYVLDPSNMSILATVNNLRRILDVATYKDELFILEEERSIIRISYHPEITVFSGDTNIAIDNAISNAEEAQESLKPETKTFDEISKEDFDDGILFRKKARRKNYNKEIDIKSTNKCSDIINSADPNLYTRPTIMNISTVGVLPDLRSPESIVNDIESKEKMLSDVLNLDKVKITLDNPDNESKEANVKEDIVDVRHYGPKGLVKSVRNRERKLEKPTGITQVINLPNDWKVSNIQLSEAEQQKPKPRLTSKSIPIVRNSNDSTSSANDSSLSDWEIV